MDLWTEIGRVWRGLNVSETNQNSLTIFEFVARARRIFDEARALDPVGIEKIGWPRWWGGQHFGGHPPGTVGIVAAVADGMNEGRRSANYGDDDYCI